MKELKPRATAERACYIEHGQSSREGLLYWAPAIPGSTSASLFLYTA
jgi:hypothetical protein